MSLFPVAPDNSLFPVPSQQQRIYPTVNQLRADRQPVQSNVSRMISPPNDNHEVLLGHHQRSHRRRHEQMQRANALNTWTDELMGRSRR